MSRIRQLVIEVHRRSLWQVLSIYLVGSWIGYQVILNLTQGVGLPSWVPAFTVVLFIIGLPIVLATAFVQEGLPGGGAARRPDAPIPAEPATSSAGAILSGDEAAADYEAPRPADAHGSDAGPGLAPRPADAHGSDAGPGLAPRPADAHGSDAGAGPPASAAAPTARADAVDRRHHWLFTWQRAVLGGIVAFVLLGITAGGYMGARNAGIGPFGALIAAGKLDERDRLLVADFGSTAADVELADALTEAFRVDLAQSPVVNLVEPRYVRELLERMGRDGAARLGHELAREAARRDGIKAVVTGEVRRAGRGYVLSASLIAADDGAVLAAFRENAADSAAVLTAVDRLSRRLRERIGESLRTVNRSAALPAVTTTSLEALMKYARGADALDREQDYAAAVALLEEAIALDSAFGMAWRKLGVAHSNSGAGRDLIVRAATRAYELRDRMSLREREYATAYYHNSVTGDLQAAIQAYRSLLEVHPRDHAALNNVALLYSTTAEHDLAVEYYERAIAADSLAPLSQTNIIAAYMAAGRLDDAERQLERFTARFGETAAGLRFGVHVAVARRDFDAATAAAQRLRELRRGNPFLREEAENLLGDIHVLHGRLARAWQHRQEALAAARERGNTWQPLLTEIWEAERDVLVRRAPELAVQRLDRAVATHPLERIPPLNRPYQQLAASYALAGQADRARHWLAELGREVPPEMRAENRIGEARMAAVLAWADRDLAGMLRIIDRLAETDPCRPCAPFWRARALDELHDERAIDEYERYLTAPGPFRIFIDNLNLAGAHERLAELYAERGDDANAARHAARFVELWSDADAELQPRVAAKRAWLRSIGADR